MLKLERWPQDTGIVQPALSGTIGTSRAPTLTWTGRIALVTASMGCDVLRR